MNFLPDLVVQGVLTRADIGHLALFAWALGASGLVALTLKEASATTRRTETFMQEFLQELARFNRNIEEDPR